jgi:hypothetical protein
LARLKLAALQLEVFFTLANGIEWAYAHISDETKAIMES